MPKGKKGGKPRTRGPNQKNLVVPGGGGRGRSCFGSDDDSVIETCSIISNASSDPKSVIDEVGSFDEPDELSQEELQEEKIIQAIDDASQKSSQGRTNCLNYLCGALTTKHMPDFIFDRYMTLADVIQRCLKKGKGKEQEAAAQLAPIICIQLGSCTESDEYFRELKPILVQIITDDSCNPLVRGKCAISVALLTFLASMDVTEMWSVLQLLERVWKNPSVDIENSTNADKQILLSYAVSSWALLLTLISKDTVHRMADQNLQALAKLLKSSDLNVRMAAGEAIALIYESAREIEEEFLDNNSDDLCQLLQQLATDSHKYRAKKDRKQQRSCFRDVIRTVEIGDYPSDSIRFGRETLELNSWRKKQQYESFCQVLHSGMNLHLTENELIRDIFNLGPVLPSMKPKQYKASKFERTQRFESAFKERTQMRGKHRDKRIVVF